LAYILNLCRVRVAAGQPSIQQLTKDLPRTGVLPCPGNDTAVSVYAPGMVCGLFRDPDMVPTGLAAGDVDGDSGS